MSAARIAAVLPTRNRADMAIRAIEHLRRQPEAELRIFVSDNSSEEEQARRLADYCGALDDPRITYCRTSGDLPQGRSWDTALRQALAQTGATHVTIHYDRKILRPGQAAKWFDAAAAFPEEVVTYVSDFVAGMPPPLRLWQPPWNGKLYRVSTAHIAAVSARGEAASIGTYLPILSNCLVPRAVVERVVARFGNLCVSTTADSCFAYRFCALHERYLHLDRALSVIYGSDRSAAVGYLTGGGGDYADYRQTWRGENWLEAGIIPNLDLGYNMLFHEYELVRREAGDRLPPLDRAGCLRDLGRWLGWIRDPAERARMAELLRKHGWDGDDRGAYSLDSPSRGVRLVRRLRDRLTLFAADRLGRRPWGITGFEFASDERALAYAVRYPSRPMQTDAHLAKIEAEEIAAPSP